MRNLNDKYMHRLAQLKRQFNKAGQFLFTKFSKKSAALTAAPLNSIILSSWTSSRHSFLAAQGLRYQQEVRLLIDGRKLLQLLEHLRSRPELLRLQQHLQQ